MLEWLLPQDWLPLITAEPPTNEKGAILLPALLARLGVAFALGCLAAAVRYASAGSAGRRRTDQALLATLVLLSVLICLVTQVIGGNLARAFSLVGALAIVRFRTVVEDMRDTSFVIYAVVSGMSAAAGYPVGPLACAPLVFAASWFFRTRPDASAPTEGILVLRLAVARPPDERITAVLAQHLSTHRLTGLATARGGAALDVTYAVPLPAADRAFVLLAELSKIEGVQGVELKDR
jgi:hypothetical protein